MAERALVAAGPWVAFLDRSEAHHDWAAERFREFSVPLFTCEPVLAECLFRDLSQTRTPGLERDRPSRMRPCGATPFTRSRAFQLQSRRSSHNLARLFLGQALAATGRAATIQSKDKTP